MQKATDPTLVVGFGDLRFASGPGSHPEQGRCATYTQFLLLDLPMPRPTFPLLHHAEVVDTSV